MTDLLKTLAVVAVGLFTTWIVKLWIGLFDNIYVAVAIWFPACLLIGLIYDRRQSRPQSNRASQEHD